MNRWNIPVHLEEKIRNRDKRCVYCRIMLKEYPHRRGVPKNKATWEHIDNDDLRSVATNIVRCCGACNTSKGTKTLVEWFRSEYCKKKNIKHGTVSAVVRDWLKRRKSR